MKEKMLQKIILTNRNLLINNGSQPKENRYLYSR